MTLLSDVASLYFLSSSFIPQAHMLVGLCYYYAQLNPSDSIISWFLVPIGGKACLDAVI